MKNSILRQSLLVFFCWSLPRHFVAFCATQLLTTYFALNTSAQAPQGIPYQAIARNASGVAIANTAIKVRFSIRDSIATGAIKYQETHNPTTSALGLFSVNVGLGTVVSGTFSGINWGKNAKFLQVELNTTGGTTYTDLGTTQMMSVPYALYAGQTVSSLSAIGSGFTMISEVSPNYIMNGAVSYYNLKRAMDYCYNLVENGYSDWRLPTLNEVINSFTLNGINSQDGAGPSRFFGWTLTSGGNSTEWYFINNDGSFGTSSVGGGGGTGLTQCVR
jgi:hypothetical protein